MADKTPKETSGWSIVIRLMALSVRYRGACAALFACQLITLGMGLAILALTGLGIDVIRYQVDPSAAPPHWPMGIRPPATWPAMGIVSLLASLILILALLRALLSYFYRVGVTALIEGKVVVHLRRQVFDKLQRLSFRFFDANASGTIISRVTTDSRNVGHFINNVLMQSVVMVLSLCISLVYLLAIHVQLTLACLATAPMLYLLAAVFSRSVQPIYRRSRELMDALILIISESFQGIKTVKGFAREAETFNRFQRANRAVQQQHITISRRVSRFVPSIGMLTQFNIVVLLVYGGHLFIDGQLALGSGLVVFAGLLQSLAVQISNSVQIVNTTQRSIIGARRVFEVLDTPVEVAPPPNPTRVQQTLGEICLDKVSFAYSRGKPVLEAIDLMVRPGESIAILGPTGAGKSTLLSLIPRFYDPSQGRVLLDGNDLRQLDPNDVRRNIGMVFQQSIMFNTTIAANIAFGYPDASPATVERAARIAAIHDFIDQLPDGYDTILAEGGRDLSDGQRQRLAIARAVLLDPAILLLDDPTASVDTHTEAKILTAMDKAMHGRTTFLVANRISTLRRTDRIVILEAGRIVETGTHNELIGGDGLYRRAVNLQVGET